MRERVTFVHAADGFRLALTEIENDPPLPAGSPAFLLIPGFAQNRRAFWPSALPRLLLERGARVFIGELRGHGRSAPPPDVQKTWSLEAHLDLDLPALLAQTRQLSGVERVHFLGHSMGGLLGTAALARPIERELASLTLFATPLLFGKQSAIVRLTALVSAPALRRAATVPIDYLLRTLAPILIAQEKPNPMRALFDIVALASARTADAEMLAEILASSEEESGLVLAELADMSVKGRALIAGIDLFETARASRLSIACVVGTNDILAPRATVDGMEEGEGPRLVVEIPDALHVDLVVGHHADELVGKLWTFLEVK